ncbi:TPA: BREX-1 system adenine-specific DNA-methyltransferase PglX [Vibrio vulnificus]|nr:BREX-1 system adenine-specific DNA-methyltransferase PglX [Vibrio vulnificus]HAS6132680.1 BREX-1 system adenine-specific DNA-methyltransferase PglX [Vibrio vulnificus]
MNTNELKKYAPKARLAFMEAVTKRAAFLGLYADRIAEMTIDGDSAVIEGRVFTRQQGQQRAQLVKRIKALGTNNGKFVLKDGFNQFINETAFTWFNRLTAIRYMEVNEYLDHGYRVLSKGEGAQFGEGFEILGSAADVADDLGLNKESIIDMVLDGNKEEELYRTILLGQCHQLSEAMPQVFGKVGFEKLDDATELLLPDNLTKTDSILKDLVNDIPEDNWQKIEVIGWLYQFYISEHKDSVIGKVVKREDIPAATQLFTPNWIVKYLVQNSLGRQWLATYPDSELKEKMEYYITPAEQSDDVIEQLKAITPTSIDPEEIKVLDPACGSGHILVEVYEVLREIYLERGYRLREIPELILTKNIYGLDIDDRAAQMAAFAVMMKAREDDKRIFSRDIKLNIHSIQSTENLNINQLWADLDFDGNQQAGSMRDLFAEPQLDISDVSAENKVYLDLLRYLKEQFIDAKNLGSLIEVDSQYLGSLTNLQEKLINLEQNGEVTEREAAKALLPIVEQAEILARQYDIVVANPPYMGSKYQTPLVKKYLKDNFKGYEKDLFSAFIIRNLQLTRKHGELGFMTPFVWMFISSYEQLRSKLIDDEIISTLIQLEYSGFDGATVPICTFTLTKGHVTDYKGSYVRLSDFKGAANQGPKTLEAIKDRDCGWFFESKSDDFKAIPGNPIAYWINKRLLSTFNEDSISSAFESGGRLKTHNDDKFVRYLWEVSKTDIGNTWKHLSHGGEFRRWYGNRFRVVKWTDTARSTYASHGGLHNKKYWNKTGITCSKITSSTNAFRIKDTDQEYSSLAPTIVHNSDNLQDLYKTIGLLNSKVTQELLWMLNPSMTMNVGDILSIPSFQNAKISSIDVQKLIEISKLDWDSFETSSDFRVNPLVQTSAHNKTISASYDTYQKEWTDLTNSCLALEENINRSLIDAYSLQDDYAVNVSKYQITLKNNCHYRYSTTESNDEKIQRYKSDSICEILCFEIGCAMGRYSLDREGLVYAHSGNNGFKELVAEGAYKTFPADDDGIVPLADEEWLFDDDATTRFREFVKTVWGEEHLQENLDFVAESLCLDAIKPKKGEKSIDTIRRYFSTQFFKDHLKTYKKRPIYWLFSSGKEKAFECLVYLHRYNESTLSRMRTEYVTPLMGKLESRKNILEDSKATATGAELRAIDKELKTIDKKQAELVKFDEELKHLAEMKISIDLDDGVKVNYGKFGNLLADVKAIHGKAPEKTK